LATTIAAFCVFEIVVAVAAFALDGEINIVAATGRTLEFWKPLLEKVFIQLIGGYLGFFKKSVEGFAGQFTAMSAMMAGQSSM